jgi:hypothetical protein
MLNRIGGAAASGLLVLLGHEKHPRIALNDEKAAAFEELAARYIDRDGASQISYELPWPKVEFLQWLRLNRPVVFHGSPRDDLTLLSTTRLSRDSSAFGNQRAVYASNDPVWAMYFALLPRGPGSGFRWTKNSCLRVGGPERLPRYSFAVNPEVLANGGLSPGTLYVLPNDTFVSDKAEFGVIDTCHLVSKIEVKPLARLAVTPDDFPFAASLFSPKHRDEVRLAIARWRARLRKG